MNLYLIALCLLAAGCLAEWKYPEWEKRLYLLCWLMLTTLLCLRFEIGRASWRERVLRLV